MDFDKLLTLGLAIYGALLSTLLGIRELRKERRQILIFLEHGEFRDLYSILITNIGHRSITLIDISMTLNGEDVPRGLLREMANPFPATLSDGQYIQIPLSQLLSGEIYEAKEKAKITVYDSENREYNKLRKLSHNEKYGIHRSK
jgi:hypothetical protein